jgi:hypothetical protein
MISIDSIRAEPGYLTNFGQDETALSLPRRDLSLTPLIDEHGEVRFALLIKARDGQALALNAGAHDAVNSAIESLLAMSAMSAMDSKMRGLIISGLHRVIDSIKQIESDLAPKSDDQ